MTEMEAAIEVVQDILGGEVVEVITSEWEDV